MLVGSLSLVITTFVGKDPSEVENLKAKVESYEKTNQKSYNRKR